MKDQNPGLHVAGNVATIKLRRPSQHNRIAPDDCAIIDDYLDQISNNPTVRVLIITGSGAKTFSSGYTLGAIVGQLDGRFENMLDHIERFPLPTICALNGSVFGGATDLALCCDFRLGVRGSRLVMPASRIGLHYYPGGIRRYIGILGLTAATKLFLTGQPIDDTEMLRNGFLTELVDAMDLASTVDRYVEYIVHCEPSVLSAMKASLATVAYGDGDEAELRARYTASLRSAELKARLDALGHKQ